MWLILTDGKQYLGQHWAIDQNTITKPRMALVGSLAWVVQDSVLLCHGEAEAAWWAARAAEVLDVELVAVPVRFEGEGMLTRLILCPEQAHRIDRRAGIAPNGQDIGD